ncbi:hypothetical protein SCYAM73S_07458 [Streptomyces cyaneofuscatus]
MHLEYTPEQQQLRTELRTVGGVQEDGPVQQREVEHDRGVVGDQDVGQGEELADVVVARDVDHRAGRAEREPGGLQVVRPDEEGAYEFPKRSANSQTSRSSRRLACFPPAAGPPRNVGA